MARPDKECLYIRSVDQVPYDDSCISIGEWKTASSIAGRGEMTSFKLGADDGLGVACLVGSGFEGGLPHMPVTV